VFASGGSEKTKFYISLNHFDQEGILIGTQYQRSNFRLNLDHKANDKFSFGTSIGLNYSTTDRVESDQSLHGVLPNGISSPAVVSVYNPDGSYNQSGPYSNALSIANEATNKNFTYRGIANIFADYNIVPGLKFSTKWGVDFYNLREHAFEFNTVQGQRYNGLGFETFRNVTNFVSNNILNYTTSFGNHNLEALVGYSFEKTQSRYIYIRGQDYASEYLQYLSTASTFVSPTANASDKGLESYFGKANYNYQGKYLATLSARLDGSSNFGDNNKYGFFPAASLGWRISEEAFFKDNLSNVISEFKLKTSFGRLGNDAASPSQFMRLYGTTVYDGRPGIYPSNIPNPDLKWETTDQFDIGLETSFFDGSINFSIEYYNKQTRDLLQGRPIPPTSGFTSIMENIGRLENKGVEVNLGANHTFGEVKWTSNLNVTANRNKVLELYGGQPIDDLGRGGNRVMEGQPIGVFYSYKWLGVDPSTGDVVYDDVDRDGVITTDDRTIVGNANPKFFGGWTNSFAYKGFDLSVFLQFVYGNDVYNGSRMYLESLQGGDNQLAVIKDRWQQPGDITNIPRATLDGTAAAWNKRVSSRFLEDGSYLRVKNVTLGYSFNRDFIGKFGLRTLRLYASAQNLLTFTKYSGLDPEVNYRGNDTSVIGTDFFTFPQARAITFGINAKF
jgi:TonB-linked SusC/RagA family outer membrane protein